MTLQANNATIDPHKVTWAEWSGMVPGMKFRVGYWNPARQQMLLEPEWLVLRGETTLTLETFTLPVSKDGTTQVFDLRLPTRVNFKFLIVTG